MSRTTYDRLVGPVVLASRPVNPQLALDTPFRSQPALAPDPGGAWRVAKAKRRDTALYLKVADLKGAERSEIAAAASRLGLLDYVPLIDAERAETLLGNVLDRISAIAREPPHDPLVSFPTGEDPEVWARLSGANALLRDEAEWVAECIEYCLDKLKRRPDDWTHLTDLAARIAPRWSPRDGTASLYRRVRSALARDRHERGTRGWVPVFALVLIRRSRVGDALIAWHALCVIAPLLLAVADSPGDAIPTSEVARGPKAAPGRDRFAHLRTDLVRSWRDVAREADKWVRLLRTIGIVERKRSQLPPGKVSAAMKRRVESLGRALPAEFGDLREFLRGIEAMDVSELRRRLFVVVERRLRIAGVASETPFGTLIGGEAAMVLSIRGELTRRSCRVCSAETTDKGRYCLRHWREYWARAKAKSRRRPRASARNLGRAQRSGQPFRLRAAARGTTQGDSRRASR